MEKTKIEWCDSTWNPLTGCYHTCEYCYARKIATRFGGWKFTPGMIRMNDSDDKCYIHPMKAYYGEAKETKYGVIAEINDPFEKNDGKKSPYPFGFTPTFYRYKLDLPQKVQSPKNIFVCSMADLFGDWIPDEWITEVFEACKKAPQHRYLFLTKNPSRYMELYDKGLLPGEDNFWYGTTITKPKDNFYISAVRNTFISLEPILEPFITNEYSPEKRFSDTEVINPCLRTVDWIILGAETGNRKDKVVPQKEWVYDIVEHFLALGKPVFMKDSMKPIWGEQIITDFPWGKGK